MNNKTVIEFGFQVLLYHQKNYGDLGGCYPPRPSSIIIILQMIQKRNSKIVKYGTVQPPCANTSRKRLSAISDHLFKTTTKKFPQSNQGIRLETLVNDHLS